MWHENPRNTFQSDDGYVAGSRFFAIAIEQLKLSHFSTSNFNFLNNVWNGKNISWNKSALTVCLPGNMQILAVNRSFDMGVGFVCLLGFSGIRLYVIYLC